MALSSAFTIRLFLILTLPPPIIIISVNSSAFTLRTLTFVYMTTPFSVFTFQGAFTLIFKLNTL